jgi:hypothetical protein
MSEKIKDRSVFSLLEVMKSILRPEEVAESAGDTLHVLAFGE